MSIEEPLEQVWTHTWDGRGIFRLLNILFKKSLTGDSPKVDQPSEIKIPLRPHQLAVVAEMENLENQSLNGHDYKNYKTYSNFGFIGDEVGTGKSLSVLSHIARMKHSNRELVSNHLLPNSCGHLFTVQTHVVKKEDATLVVIPHTIFRQWQTYIKDHSSLKVFAIKTRANLNQDTFANNVNESDFVLVSNTLYGECCEMAANTSISWKRMIFDEADSIHITSTAGKPNAGFIWFVTASWANFVLNGTILRNHLLQLITGVNQIPGLDPEMIQWVKNELGTTSIDRYTLFRMKSPNFFRNFLNASIFRGLQVIRCRDVFIEESMTMPPIIPTQIICEQPFQEQIVHGLVNQTIQSMLHGGDIAGALENLGVKAEEPTTLLKAFTAQQEKELDRLEKTFAFKESMDYATPQAKELALAHLSSKINSIKMQMKTFAERIDSLKTELCPICYEEPKNTTITPCCHRIFCGECMLTSLTRQSTCPMCRKDIKTNTLIHVSNAKKSKKEVKKSKNPRKPDALLNLIMTNPDARILVFSRYENPFVTLSSAIENSGVSVQVLKGNKDCIANTIKNFESGDKRVLFLPTQTAAAGMNLVSATHVVLYHAMTPEEERQVIGRAYRLGRKEPLSVVRLVHENETIL